MVVCGLWVVCQPRGLVYCRLTVWFWLVVVVVVIGLESDGLSH